MYLYVIISDIVKTQDNRKHFEKQMSINNINAKVI